MLWPQTCRFCESPKPQSFAALMDMYEHNYMRLRCLCPQLREMQGRYVSKVAGMHDLILTVLETSSHTTQIELTYEMEGGDTRPDLRIRVCNDSHQAEVISRKCRIRPGIQTAAAEDVREALRCRWQMNRFLYKWLNYCHRQGHGFADCVPATLSNIAVEETCNSSC